MYLYQFVLVIIHILILFLKFVVVINQILYIYIKFSKYLKLNYFKYLKLLLKIINQNKLLFAKFIEFYLLALICMQILGPVLHV